MNLLLLNRRIRLTGQIREGQGEVKPPEDTEAGQDSLPEPVLMVETENVLHQEFETTENVSAASIEDFS